MSENELSGSESDNEPNNRHIISKKEDTLRSLSDDEGVDHPRDNMKSISSSSDNERDFTKKIDENDNDNYNDNDNENENKSPPNTDYRKDSSSDEADQKTKKKGRKRRSKKDDENENSEEGEKVDKEIEELVKNASKTRSVKYIERENEEEYYEGKARAILKQMANALQKDYQTYKQRKPPFERLKYLTDLQSQLNNKKLAKYLLRDNFLNYLAAWISPYEAREGDSNTEPVYPLESFRVDILKLLLKLKLKPEYFEDAQDGRKSQIIKVLQEMPVEEGSEIAKLNTQVLNKIIRILTHADDEKVSSSLIIDKDEAAEIKKNKDSEIGSYYNKLERKLEKAAMAKRKSKAVERPRDYIPPPRIINTNIKAKRRGNL